MYFVERVPEGYSRFSVKGESVDITLTCYSPFSSYDKEIKKVEGKGSKKIKDLLPRLIENFVKQEDEAKRIKLKNQGRDFTEKFVAACKADASVWRSIDNRKLYNVTLNSGTDWNRGAHDDTITSEKEMTGKDLKRNINYKEVIAYEEIKISNTDLFSLGSAGDYKRHAAEDQRIIIGMGAAYVTGLTMKEKLSNGDSYYGHRCRTVNGILDEFKKFANGNMIELFSSKSGAQQRQDGQSAYEQLMQEIERAKATPEDKEIFNTTETAIIEVYNKYDTFYFGETYHGVGDAAMDKTADIKAEEGDYLEGFYTGMFIEWNGHLYNLYHPTINHGNPRKQQA